MTHFIPGQGGYGKAMLMALLVSVLAACGGGGKTDMLTWCFMPNLTST